MKKQWKNIKKLGLGIMAFEGSEHIENILTELRDLIDFTIIAYQDVSYHNDPIDQSDLLTIRSLEDSGLVDAYINIELDKNKEARKQETDKRNIIIQYAEDNGCSHVIIIDSDEFYTADSFYNALKEIDENDYDITYCQYVNYYHDYKHYLVYPFENGMYVPFVSKAKYRFVFETSSFPYPSDPTRRYYIPKKYGNPVTENYIFPWETVKMHHLSWVRANIRKKLKAWSSKKCFENQELMIDRAVYDWEHFDDKVKNNNGEKIYVHLLFNTPGNMVEVAEFPKQYIFPKKDINKTYIYAEQPKNILIVNMSSPSGNGLFEELEKTCRDTWVKQIDEYNLQYNMTYFSVIHGVYDKIDFDNKVIYVRNRDSADDLHNLAYRFIKAVQMLKEAGYNYEYYVRTNTSTWLNLPLIDKIIANEQDESIIYGFSYQSAFWSQYNLYLTGQLLIMSDRQFNIIAESLEKLNYLPYVSDDVAFGGVFYTRCNYLNIPQTTYMKTFPALYGDVKNETVASQIKNFKTNDFEKRKLTEPAAMRKVNDKWNKNMKSGKFSIDKAYQKFLKLKDDMIINIIPETKEEWMTITDKYLRECRYLNPVNYKGKYHEFKEESDKLKKKAGYKI